MPSNDSLKSYFRGSRLLKNSVLLLGISLSALTNGDASHLVKTQFRQTVEFERVTLQVGEHLLDTEVAETPAQRSQGLMWRESLPENSAMLFIMDTQNKQCFWMRNTLIPLTVAFIDSNGRIIEFFDMQPLSDETHCATQPAQFGLEVNQGWFARKGITAGERIRLIEDEQSD
ncbi:DUF192 domain-containing protein [Nitrincola sp. MINF-07-Sa-05]|uniref:DUF192 domain-containing protein n=1 Tax=Nitrincola salilacus TaxID=3400273 RepID=UPI003917F9FC